MNEQPIAAVIQRDLDELPGNPAGAQIIRELLERAVGRLRRLCGNILYRGYPRLTDPPLNWRLTICWTTCSSA
jgi:hypothetical protein